MVKVYTDGLYHYEIIGEREKEAADEMENKLDLLSRSHYGIVKIHKKRLLVL